MDINNFKQINDTYGHDCGDKALRHFSRLLVESFGSSWFIARYGGDEFILLRETTTQQEMEADKAYFDQQLAHFNARDPFPFSLSVSIGSALYSATKAEDGPSYIRALDHLMYENKRAYHIQQKENQKKS